MQTPAASTSFSVTSQLPDFNFDPQVANLSLDTRWLDQLTQQPQDILQGHGPGSAAAPNGQGGHADVYANYGHGGTFGGHGIFDGFGTGFGMGGFGTSSPVYNPAGTSYPSGHTQWQGYPTDFGQGSTF